MDVANLAICLGLIALIVYVLGKLKLLSTLALIFLAVVFLFLIMSFIPALQVEPVHSLLKSFFEGLPDMFSKFMDYVGRFMGGVFRG